MLRTDDLDYTLPPELIATRAAEPRDSARLLVTDRRGHRMEDRHVRDLPDLLVPGDVLVFNTTRVLPARFLGRRVGTGGRAEGLYLAEAEDSSWICLLRGGHLRPGAQIELDTLTGEPSGIVLTLLRRDQDDAGAWVVRVEGGGGVAGAASASAASSDDILARIGRTPLPPYILKARQASGIAFDEREDRQRYQTVFATTSAEAAAPTAGVYGSVAAPTAGLHFTPELLRRLEARGIQRLDVTLHVGTGTFRPVESEFVEQHPMHGEWCSMAAGDVDRIRQARREGRRIIPVGSTSARTLESYASHEGASHPPCLSTRILIAPGHAWRWCDGMVTNFHLPRSTLMAMVGSLFDRGVPRLREIYHHAVNRGYRFYSYGDAMIVLP